MRRGRLCAILGLVVLEAACQRAQPSGPPAIRLVDLHRPPATQPGAPTVAPPARTEWRFAGTPPTLEKDAATWGWSAFNGVAGLAVRNGRLVGRTTSGLPILHLQRSPGFEEREAVYGIDVHMRVSAGTSVAVALDGSKQLDRDQALDMARHFTWGFTAPLTPSDALQTHSMRTQFSVVTGDSRNVFVRPSDVPGATFEIESVRLVTRREHLAEVPSGLGWQALSEVYKETLVARAPDTLRFEVTLPARPVLDLAVGTVEEAPVRFRVRVEPSGDEVREVLERTVTRPHRWEAVPIDLSAWAGRKVTLALTVEAESPGAIGFWGAPTVRAKGAAPRTEGAAGLERPQGVILVWADTLRRDHVGIYGHSRPTTPVLDRLAREGVLFRDCIGQATWTKVATPSLLTSLYPSSHGVNDFMDRLPSSATTLAEVYRDAGYATLSLSSILFTGRFSNLHQGFEEVHEDSSLSDRTSSKTAREYVDRLLPWLESHREVPFFVFLHVSDPHDPYRPYPPYDSMWADASKTEEHERRGKALRKTITDPLLRNMGSAMPTRDDLLKAGIDSEDYVRHDRDWYDGSIRGLDAEMGRLTERLRALGLDRRILLVFTGDHGEEFLEHGRMLHGQSVYGELSNMALMFWGPGIVPRGAEVSATVQTIDLMPTLLEASGLPLPPSLQGRSLLPLIQGMGSGGAGAVGADGPGRWADRPAITEKAVTADTGAPPPRDTESVALVFEGFKLIHNTKRPPGRPEYELFDHQRDPLDRADLAAQRPELVQRLGRELDAWRRAMASSRLAPDAEAGRSLSKDELERLRALGYVQ